MTLKQNSQALENKEENYSGSKGAVGEGAESLLKEINLFIKRNSLNEGHFCEKCLKAHILKKASEFKVSSELIKKLNSLSKVEIGHSGYYLDENNLVRI